MTTSRSQSSPLASILSQTFGRNRIDLCTRRWASGFLGRPPLFFGCSMRLVYVMQKLLECDSIV